MLMDVSQVVRFPCSTSQCSACERAGRSLHSKLQRLILDNAEYVAADCTTLPHVVGCGLWPRVTVNDRMFARSGGANP
jgi:hypothetical protein